MGKATQLVLATLLLAGISFAGVTISSPTPGSTSASPVKFVASASSSSPITGMRIYVDNVSVFSTTASSISTSLAITVGTHSVVVQAWDSTGAVLKSSESITVNTSAGVSVSSPANGATVSSPFQVVASASAANPIVGMKIYLDNTIVYSTSAASLNTSISAGAGSHSLTVQAWDSTGAVYKDPLSVTVSSSGLPVPPSTAIVFSNIEDMTGWQSCTVCAGAGGSGPVAAFSMTQFQSSPSLDGSSAKFSIGGTTAYADALWWKQLGPNNAIKNFKYDLDFYSTAPQNAEALEFDVNQGNGIMKFIFGTECSPKDGAVWKVWDNAGATWRSTGITCTAPSAFAWHHLTWEFQRNSTQVIFIGFTLDGVTHFVNRTYNANASGSQEINVAFQMDLDSTAQAYSVWLDRVKLAYW